MVNMLQLQQELHGLESATKVEDFLKRQLVYNPLILYNNKVAAGGGGGEPLSSLNPGRLNEKKSQEAAHKHALAERNRRRRINTHLNTLRKLFPYLPKRDKPRVLMETVKYLKELREKVAAADRYGSEEGCCTESGGDGGGASSLFLPGEKDEFDVSCCEGDGDDDQGEVKKLVVAKAVICCEDRPRLNGELTAAVKSVNGKVVKAEMATVGGRTKAVLVVKWGVAGRGTAEDIESLRRALKAVVENRALGCCSTLLGSDLVNPCPTSLGCQYNSLIGRE